MKKYKLTNETLEYRGRTLHRIEALRSFGDVEAGDKGGWIESENNLAHDGLCWVADEAKVCGGADVIGDAWVCEEAEVLDQATVADRAEVGGRTVVRDRAQVCGEAVVIGDGLGIVGDTVVTGNARLYGSNIFRDGLFVGGLDGDGKVTDITELTDCDYWDHQYVLGDYEVVVPPKKHVVVVDDQRIELTDDDFQRLKKLLSLDSYNNDD